MFINENQFFQNGFYFTNWLHLVSGINKKSFIPIQIPESFVFSTHALIKYTKRKKKIKLFFKCFVLGFYFRNWLHLVSDINKKKFHSDTTSGKLHFFHPQIRKVQKLSKKFKLFSKWLVLGLSFTNWLFLMSTINRKSFTPISFLSPTHSVLYFQSARVEKRKPFDYDTGMELFLLISDIKNKQIVKENPRIRKKVWIFFTICILSEYVSGKNEAFRKWYRDETFF